jgi:fatty-acyl-CoA synthase
MGLGRNATLVVSRRFDAQATLEVVDRHRARVLVVVPVMLQRMLALGPDELVRVDTSTLEVIASSGSALGGRLATEILNRFGPVLYNIYGSTEVAAAAIATPSDLRRAPTTVGRPAPGVEVELLDDAGQPVETGQVGRVFVGSSARFDGYTSGGGKESQHGLLSSGDVGHFDADGRLYIDGRDDDMIVSGGENLYPSEVEELLTQHPAVAEVAVIGVADEEFGQALAAFVVVRPGQALTVDDIRQHVRTRLARYKVPRRVTFLDELPRNATGKVLKRALAGP